MHGMGFFATLLLFLGVGCMTSQAQLLSYPPTSTHGYPRYAPRECLELQTGWPCVYSSKTSRTPSDVHMPGYDRRDAARGAILVSYLALNADPGSQVRIEFHREGRYSMDAPPGVSVILFDGYVDADMDDRELPPIIEVFIGGDPLLGTKLPEPRKYFESTGSRMTVALVTFPKDSNNFSPFFTHTQVNTLGRSGGDEAEQLSYIIGGSIGGVVVAGLVGFVVVTRNRKQVNHAVSSFSAAVSPFRSSSVKKEPDQMFPELNSDNPLFNEKSDKAAR